MRVDRFEHDPTLTPDAMEAERAQIDNDVDAWANGPETMTSEDGGEAMLLPIPIGRARLWPRSSGHPARNCSRGRHGPMSTPTTRER